MDHLPDARFLNVPGTLKVPGTVVRYSHEQGLASRELTVEELFHPSTLGFSEPMT